jgi:hypothetical protein
MTAFGVRRKKAALRLRTKFPLATIDDDDPK